MLLYADAATAVNIRVISLTDSADVRSLTNSSFFESMARVSPNGEYVAYTSNESGRREVYVRRFDGSGGKWQISTEHAENPRWNKDGTELYYLTYDLQVMGVKVNTRGDFVAENPAELFKTSLRYPLDIDFPYDVTGDGQRFLANKELSESDPGEIVVVQNWATEFKKK
jgi:serine/threonine-protein kinase